MNGAVTVAFVDDHPILLKGLSAIFSLEKSLNIVALGSTADDIVQITETHRPNVLITDLSMPGDVFSAISMISRLYPSTRAIVFTAFSSIDAVLKALDAGATGFVLKGGRVEEITEAVNSVMRGEMFITRQYAGQVLGGLRDREARSRKETVINLNVREKQIIALLMQAQTNREIAIALRISEKTVKYYMSILMHKLNARNRLEVVIAAQKADALHA